MPGPRGPRGRQDWGDWDYHEGRGEARLSYLGQCIHTPPNGDGRYPLDDAMEPDFHSKVRQFYMQSTYRTSELPVNLRKAWGLQEARTCPWMILRGRSQDDDVRLAAWAEVIIEDLGCDQQSCQLLQTLCVTNPRDYPHGRAEACKILAHMLKDKQRPREQPRPWGAYLRTSCEEAFEALEDAAHVHDLHLPDRQRRGPGAAPWVDQGKGKGKGKAGPAPVPHWNHWNDEGSTVDPDSSTDSDTTVDHDPGPRPDPYPWDRDDDWRENWRQQAHQGLRD